MPRQIVAGSDITIAPTAIIRVDDTTSTAARAATPRESAAIARLRRITSRTVATAKITLVTRANPSIDKPVSLCAANNTA